MKLIEAPKIIHKINIALFLVNALMWGSLGNIPACIGWTAAALYCFIKIADIKIKELSNE